MFIECTMFKEKMCQSSINGKTTNKKITNNKSNKSISEHHQLYAELSNDRCAKKVQLTFDKQKSIVAKSFWLNEQTINYYLDKRSKWIIFNGIILVFSIISHFLKFNFELIHRSIHRSIEMMKKSTRLKMIRFCNSNKINLSFNNEFYISIIIFFILTINTIGKLISLISFN